jgi:peroxin-6
MDEEQRNKLISETLQGITTVTDEVHSCSFSEQKLLCSLTLHLLLMQFHFSDYWQVCKRFSSANIRFHAQGLALVADAGVSFTHEVAAEIDNKQISKHEKVLQESSSTSQNEEKHFCKEDILSSLERAKKRNRTALGTPKVKRLSLLSGPFW